MLETISGFLISPFQIFCLPLTQYQGETPELRRRYPKAAEASCSESAKSIDGLKFHVQDPIQVLKAGLRTVRHHTVGWLKDDLISEGKLDGTKEKLYAKMFQDYNAQQIYIRAKKTYWETTLTL
jgi:hypothetical protein